MSDLALCLSGGGFRALLFHLGVIFRLARAGRLKDVTRIDAVSGGSVLAAHLVLHWDDYIENARSAAGPLLDWLGRDVRNRVIRRRLLLWLLLIPPVRGVARWLLPKGWFDGTRFYVTDFLVREYAELYGNATLYGLCQGKRPDLHIHSTSVTTGAPCSFLTSCGSDGERREPFARHAVRPALMYPASETPLALAVAASSAFPPLFQPVHLTPNDVARDQHGNRLGKPLRLTDGGVFDNLGVDYLLHGGSTDGALVVVSDASGEFNDDDTRTFGDFVTRNIRVAELMMDRVGQLERQALEPLRAKTVKIGTGAAFSSPKLEALRGCRTDLDRFSQVERDALIYHGDVAAGETLRGVIPDAAAPPAPEASLKELLAGSGHRWWRLLSPTDPVVLVIAAVVALWGFGIAAFTAYVANTPTLTLTREQWIATSARWLNEPSDIVTLRDGARPLFLTVDDDEPGLFVVRLLPDARYAVLATWTFGDKEPNDLEGLAVNGNRSSGVAITSFRQNPGGKRQRHLLKFAIPKPEELERSQSPQFDEHDITEQLATVLAMNSVSLDTNLWKVPDEDTNPEFALEIEGLAFERDDVVTIGLKWPLKDDEAILLDYHLKTRTLTWRRSVPLQGMGISGLTWHNDILYVAANPPQKATADSACDPQVHGRSVVFALERDSKGAPTRAKFDAVQPCTKLEGLAVLDGQIIGAYEGKAPLIREIECDAAQPGFREQMARRWEKWFGRRPASLFGRRPGCVGVQ